jgi:hypothetical protein
MIGPCQKQAGVVINLNRRRAFAMFGVYEHTRAQPVIIGKEKERERERASAAPNRINQIEGEPGGVKGDEKHNRRIITNSL